MVNHPNRSKKIPAPKYVIVNETDRPSPSLVAQVIDGKAHYLDHRLAHFPGLDISHATDIEKFGFLVEEKAGHVFFTKIGDSIARYPDGKPRAWQSNELFFNHPMRAS